MILLGFWQFFFVRKSKGNQKGNQTYVRLTLMKGEYLARMIKREDAQIMTIEMTMFLERNDLSRHIVPFYALCKPL